MLYYIVLEYSMYSIWIVTVLTITSLRVCSLAQPSVGLPHPQTKHPPSCKALAGICVPFALALHGLACLTHSGTPAPQFLPTRPHQAPARVHLGGLAFPLWLNHDLHIILTSFDEDNLIKCKEDVRKVIAERMSFHQILRLKATQIEVLSARLVCLAHSSWRPL